MYKTYIDLPKTIVIKSTKIESVHVPYAIKAKPIKEESENKDKENVGKKILK